MAHARIEGEGAGREGARGELIGQPWSDRRMSSVGEFQILSLSHKYCELGERNLRLFSTPSLSLLGVIDRLWEVSAPSTVARKRVWSLGLLPVSSAPPTGW